MQMMPVRSNRCRCCSECAATLRSPDGTPISFDDGEDENLMGVARKYLMTEYLKRQSQTTQARENRQAIDSAHLVALGGGAASSTTTSTTTNNQREQNPLSRTITTATSKVHVVDTADDDVLVLNSATKKRKRGALVLKLMTPPNASEP